MQVWLKVNARAGMKTHKFRGLVFIFEDIGFNIDCIPHLNLFPPINTFLCKLNIPGNKLNSGHVSSFCASKLQLKMFSEMSSKLPHYFQTAPYFW